MTLPPSSCETSAEGRGRIQQFQRRLGALVFAALLIFLLRHFLLQESHAPLTLQGQAFGTTWNVVIADAPLPEGQDALERGIESVLDTINRSMSHYLPDSKLSRFNRFHETGVPFPVSDDLAEVVRRSGAVSAVSGGAFDITVAPLVELWGFGSASIDAWPEPHTVQQALKVVGWEKVSVTEVNDLVKQIPEVTINVSAIAKGYAVDQVSAFLWDNQVTHFLVDIGGEMRASGKKAADLPWRIGIENPVPGSLPGDQVFGVLKLQDRSLATSGEYRQVTTREGRTFSHTVDPRTGYPVTHSRQSVAVLAPTCMEADAYATALNVLGPSAGIALVETLPGVEALYILPDPDGTFTFKASSGFPPLEK